MMVRFYSYFFFLSFSSSFHVGSYTLADSENNQPSNEIWETKEIQTAQHGLDLNQKYQSDWNNFINENQIPKIDTLAGANGGKVKWSSVLTFDRLKNLTEKDKGPGNDTKVIFINSEDRLTIYENDDDDDDENETGIQDRDRQRFSLLSPEGLLSRIHSSEEKGLERSKRQAESGKKKCRCRRKGRRVVRRRRRRRRGRRRRVGQARQGRRRRRGRRRGAGRRRRGRRRCVCRKNGGGEGNEGGEGGEGGEEGGEGGEDGEGKGDEEPEIEEADGGGETTTTEGGEESGNEEEGKEGGEANEDEEGDGTMGDGDEEEEDEEGDTEKGEEENEDSEDEESMESEDESDEKGRSDERSEKNLNKKQISMSGINHEVPVYVMYPGTPGTYGATPNAARTAGTPTYTTLPVPFSPYPYYSGNKK